MLVACLLAKIRDLGTGLINLFVDHLEVLEVDLVGQLFSLNVQVFSSHLCQFYYAILNRM